MFYVHQPQTVYSGVYLFIEVLWYHLELLIADVLIGLASSAALIFGIFVVGFHLDVQLLPRVAQFTIVLSAQLHRHARRKKSKQHAAKKRGNMLIRE